MLFTVTCWKFQKIQQPYIERYFYVFFSTNIVEILLKLWADASSGSGAVKAFLIATRFWVVMICPNIKCLTVLRVFFYFVWFVFINHNFQFYFKLCTYCNILNIYLSLNLNFVNYLLFYMKLLNYLFFNMFGSVLECCELTGVSLLWPWLIKWKKGSLFKN